jgi:hypothetical protein
MTSTFVSYSRVDSPFVEKLHAALLKIGHPIWLDAKEIGPLVDWLVRIERAIEEATSFVFVISPNSLASEICMHELRHALAHRKRIIALVRHGPSGRPVPDELAGTQWIAAGEDDDFDAVLRGLVTALSSSATASASRRSP